MDDTIFFANTSISYSTKSLQPPPHFHPQVFPNLDFLIPSWLLSLSFIIGDTACPGLDFTVWKPNTRTKRGDDEGARKQDIEGREAHKQTDDWVWKCHSRLCTYTLWLFFCLFCPFCYKSVYPLCRDNWTSVYTVACWNEEEHTVQMFILANLRADWKLSKVTISCKTTQHIHSKPEHKTELFVFCTWVIV